MSASSAPALRIHWLPVTGFVAGLVGLFPALAAIPVSLSVVFFDGSPGIEHRFAVASLGTTVPAAALGVVAIVFAAIALGTRRAPRGLAVAALVLGTLAVLAVLTDGVVLGTLAAIGEFCKAEGIAGGCS